MQKFSYADITNLSIFLFSQPLRYVRSEVSLRHDGVILSRKINVQSMNRACFWRNFEFSRTDSLDERAHQSLSSYWNDWGSSSVICLTLECKLSTGPGSHTELKWSEISLTHLWRRATRQLCKAMAKSSSWSRLHHKRDYLCSRHM